MESNKKAATEDMDIIVEILSTLRVKDLIRFKSVCKAWFQLISSQEFIQLHLKNSRFRSRLQSVYFIGSPPHRNFLIHPQPQCQNRVVFVGNSCDGLACLLNKRLGIIHIWNPAIRESACFPTKKIRLPIICFWFGYHDNGCKLILGTGPYRMYDVDEDDLDEYDDGEYEMHLIKPCVGSHSYISTRQGFRKKDDQEFYDKQGTLSNGNVHWVVSREQRSRTHVTILCYNLGEEMVGRIAVPPASEGNHIEDYDLGEIDGCFSALRFLDYKGERVWG